MLTETSAPRTRRALLTAALGAGVATIAAALGRPLPARAADGDPVLVGHIHTASTVTKFDAGASVAGALWGNSSSNVGVYGTSSSNMGVQGISSTGTGVRGTSSSSNGVAGFSPSSIGVYGASTSYIGVYGYSVGAGVPGTFGVSDGATGVQGYSGSASPPAAPAKTGVFGFAKQDETAIGVLGQTTAGRGVQGEAEGGFGVRAAAADGVGLEASATTGTAIHATTSGPRIGTALQTVGRVRFDKSVGIATIGAGKRSVTVTPGIDLSATSAVVATLQGNPAGTLAVKSVAVNATTDKLIIYLTAKTTRAVKVAWHVFG